ncbi:MAG: fibronectin type III domain-containing protein [Eubacterium sp.]|nr:fibronectin type III domain-containing protein [Eubacterium sp.]
MKRTLSLLLSIIMLFSCFSAGISSSAAEKTYALDKLKQIQTMSGFIHGQTAIVTGNCYQFVSKVCEKLYGVKYDGEGLYDNYKSKHLTGNYYTVATMTTPKVATLTATDVDNIKKFFIQNAMPGDVIHYGSLDASKSAKHTVMVQSVDNEKLVVYQANYQRMDLPAQSCHVDTIYWSSFRANPTKSIYNSDGKLYSLNSLFYNKVKQGGTGIGITINRFKNYGNLFHLAYYSTPIVSSSRPSTSSIKLSWNAIPGAEKYQIQYKKSTDSTYLNLINTLTTTSYEAKGLEIGTTYNFRVRVAINDTWMGWSEVITKQVLPPTISAAVFTVEKDGLRMRWTKRSDITGVRVLKSTTSNGTYTTVKTETNNDNDSYLDKSVKINTNYYYKFQRYINVGGKEYSTTSKVFTGKYVLATPKISYKKINSSSVIFIIEGDGNEDYFIYNVYKDNKVLLKQKSCAKYATIKDMSVGSEYVFTTCEKNAIGNGAAAKVTFTMSPRAVEDVKVNPVTDGIRVGFKAYSDVDGYNVYRSTQEKSGYTKIATLEKKNNNVYVDKTVKPSTLYYYKVAAYKKADSKNYVGDKSAASVKVWNKLSAPTASAVRKTCTSLNVKWNKINLAKSYTLQYRVAGQKKWKTIKTGITTNHLVVSGLSMGATYEFRVKAVNPIGSGPYSAAVSKKVLPPTPSALSAKPVSGGLRLDWKGNSTVSGYEVYRSTSLNGTYTKLGTVKRAGYWYFIDLKAQKNKTYYYKVRAYKVTTKKTYYSPYSAKLCKKYA